MKYKVVYQFKWILILIWILIIYTSNLILVKLPYIGVSFNETASNNHSIFNVLSLLPNINFEFQFYNLQILSVWFCGIVCERTTGLVIIAIYLLLGLLGLPLFAGGGGISYLMEPTFGYLLSFPVLIYLSNYFYAKNKKILAVLLPIFCSHLIGILYILIFRYQYLEASWYISYSMIGYDILFALILIWFAPVVSFFFNEMFIQEKATFEEAKKI